MAPFNSHPPTEDPVALIRQRIKEKRVFEARFLFRQFGDLIGTDQKMKLADELAAKLSRAEQLLQRARSHAAGGERSLAAQVYREIESIVVDMPGVAEEAKALAESSTLISKRQSIAPIAEEPRPEASKGGEDGPAFEPEGVRSATSRRKRRRPRWPFWLAAVSAAAVIALLVLWYVDVKQPPPPAAKLEQPASTILIRPMVAEQAAAVEPAVAAPAPGPADSSRDGMEPPVPEAANQPPSDSTASSAPEPPPPVQAPANPHPTLRLGTLQVQQSPKK